MSFKKMQIPQYPPRLWVLVGYPGSGKSTFATQMRYPLLPIDADHRFEEVAHLASGDIYQLSDNPADSVDPETIYKLLNANMPGTKVGTITVDSLTTIITPLVVQAIMDNDAGRNKNRMSAFKDKALAMRMLQDAVSKWGCDVLWIYHLQDSRNEQAKEITRPTLSATERARLYRSINLELHIVEEQLPGSKRTRRGIKVIWARRGRSGMTIWDDTNHWAGMPEKIEQAVYGGLSVEEQNKIEQEAPAAFPTEEAAIEWGMSQGVFGAVNHARNAWNKLKKDNPNLTLARLSVLWVDDVEGRQPQKEEVPGKPQEEPAPEAVESATAPVTTIPETKAPEEKRDQSEEFAYRVMVEIGFFESREEVAAALAHLGVIYTPDKEEALVEMLRLHVQALPTFTTFEKVLYQLHEDFELSEKEAKAKLKELGFTTFPSEGNGQATARSRRMYWKVMMVMPGKVKQAEPEEIEF